MSIVLHEREWVEDVISNPQLGKRPSETLERVARYYIKAEGYNKRQARDKLDSFLFQCDPKSAGSQWSTMMDNAVKSAEKKDLVDLDGVDVYAEELETIAGIESRQIRRLAFTLLCVAKYRNAINPLNNGWVTDYDVSIIQTANIHASKLKQNAMFMAMRERGLIGYSKKVDNLSVRVDYLREEGTPKIFITDFRNLGYQYQFYLGEPFLQCSHCGLTVKRGSNSHKYCKECAAEMYVKQSVESVMRKRASVT